MMDTAQPSLEENDSNQMAVAILPSNSSNSISSRSSSSATSSVQAHRRSSSLVRAKSHPLLDFLSHTKVEELASSPLVEVKSDQLLSDAFKLLVEKKIHSAPVWDPSEQKYVSIIDINDIVSAIDLFHDDYEDCQEMKSMLQNYAPERKSSKVDDILSTENFFKNLRVRDIANLAQENPFIPLPAGSSVEFALRTFIEKDARRLPVVSTSAQVSSPSLTERKSSGGTTTDAESKEKKSPRVEKTKKEKDDHAEHIVAYVTRTKLLAFLWQHRSKWSALGEWTIGELFGAAGASPRPSLITITTEQSAFDAFRTMMSAKLSGLPVVDSSFRVIANISNSDLKVIGYDAKKFKALRKPVLQFLEKAHRKQWNIFSGEEVISCTASDTFIHLIDKMLHRKIHRIYYVDKNQKLLGVISVRDVLERFLTF